MVDIQFNNMYIFFSRRPIIIWPNQRCKHYLSQKEYTQGLQPEQSSNFRSGINTSITSVIP
jgi:hypothetical protein